MILQLWGLTPFFKSVSPVEFTFSEFVEDLSGTGCIPSFVELAGCVPIFKQIEDVR